MGFTDQKYYNRDIVIAGIGAVATATASGTNTLSTVLRTPLFAAKTKLFKFRVEVVTAPATTTTLVALLNGTNTLAVATLGTLTAGQGIDANINGQAVGQTDLTQIVTTSTLPNGQRVVTTTRNAAADINAGTDLTVAIITTATASAQAAGTFDAYLTKQDNY